MTHAITAEPNSSTHSNEDQILEEKVGHRRVGRGTITALETSLSCIEETDLRRRASAHLQTIVVVA